MTESCYIYEWDISHIWMSHVTVWMSHVPRMNESCHTYISMKNKPYHTIYITQSHLCDHLHHNHIHICMYMYMYICLWHTWQTTSQSTSHKVTSHKVTSHKGWYHTQKAPYHTKSFVSRTTSQSTSHKVISHKGWYHKQNAPYHTIYITQSHLCDHLHHNLHHTQSFVSRTTSQSSSHKVASHKGWHHTKEWAISHNLHHTKSFVSRTTSQSTSHKVASHKGWHHTKNEPYHTICITQSVMSHNVWSRLCDMAHSSYLYDIIILVTCDIWQDTACVIWLKYHTLRSMCYYKQFIRDTSPFLSHIYDMIILVTRDTSQDIERAKCLHIILHIQCVTTHTSYVRDTSSITLCMISLFEWCRLCATAHSSHAYHIPITYIWYHHSCHTYNKTLHVWYGCI